MSLEQFANLATTTLAAALDAVSTTVTIANPAPFPTSAQFRLVVDSELMLVTAIPSAGVFTVQRGIEGTSAVPHSVGASVSQVVTKASLLGLGPQPLVRVTAAMSPYTATANTRLLVDASGGAVSIKIPSLVYDSVSGTSQSVSVQHDQLTALSYAITVSRADGGNLAMPQPPVPPNTGVSSTSYVFVAGGPEGMCFTWFNGGSTGGTYSVRQEGGYPFEPGGDLTGGFSSQTVIAIQGHAVASTTPSTGNVLAWNGTAWAPDALSSIPVSGDLSGSVASAEVVGILSHALPALSTGYLEWNGSAWAFAASIPLASLPNGSTVGAPLLAGASAPAYSSTFTITQSSTNPTALTDTSGYGLSLAVPASKYASISVGGTAMLQFGNYVGAGCIWNGGVTPSGTNYALYTSTTTTYLNAASATYILVGGSTVAQFGGSISWSVGQLQWNGGVANPQINQAQPNSDVATTNLAITAQAAYASASTNLTGASLRLTSGAGATTNGTPGNVYLNTPAPTGTGAAGYVVVQNGGVSQWQMGTVLGNSAYAALYPNALAPTSSNYALAATTGITILNSTSSVQMAVSGTVYASLTTAGFQLNTAAQLYWGAAVNSPTITQTSTGTNTGQSLTIQSQASTNATAGTPGNIILNTPAPTGTGANGYVVVQNGGTAVATLGTNGSTGALWLGLGGTTPSGTNVALSANSTSTFLNAPASGGSVLLLTGNVTQATVTSGSVSLVPPILAWASGVSSPSLSQTTPGTDTAPSNLTISAQSAYASAATHTIGANLVLAGGAGATSSATYTGGGLILRTQAGNALANNGTIQLQNGATTFGTLSNLTASTSLTIQSGGSIYLQAGGTNTAVAVSSTIFEWYVSTVTWGAGATPILSHSNPGADTATATVTITAQSAYSGATTNLTGGAVLVQSGAGATTNGTPGNIFIRTPAPSGTGTYGTVQLQNGLSSYLTVGLNTSSTALLQFQQTSTIDATGNLNLGTTTAVNTTVGASSALTLTSPSITLGSTLTTGYCNIGLDASGGFSITTANTPSTAFYLVTNTTYANSYTAIGTSTLRPVNDSFAGSGYNGTLGSSTFRWMSAYVDIHQWVASYATTAALAASRQHIIQPVAFQTTSTTPTTSVQIPGVAVPTGKTVHLIYTICGRYTTVDSTNTVSFAQYSVIGQNVGGTVTLENTGALAWHAHNATGGLYSAQSCTVSGTNLQVSITPPSTACDWTVTLEYWVV